MQSPDEFLTAHDIFRIKVETPYLVGPVNSYLIKKRPYTLIDPGPDTDEAKEALSAGLAKAGVKPEEIERVIITHWHTDHSGLAAWLNNLAGAQVLVHRLEVRKMQDKFDAYLERIPFLHEEGMPQKELDEILADEDPVPPPVLPAKGVTILEGDEILQFAGMKLRVLHLPGHSGGHICLYDEENQIFFAGDFILKHITPNPLMEGKEPDYKERLPVLSQYINSLHIFAGLPIKLVLPGHGSYIDGNREIAEKALNNHQEKIESYLSLIRGKEINTYQLMRLIYPKVKGFEIYLAMSEVIAHLDYLISGGKLSAYQKDGVIYYTV